MIKRNPEKRVEARLRHFSHANSDRKASDRYQEERDEAMEYTDSFSTLRKGKRACKDIYDDEYIVHADKYRVKPKEKEFNRNTIRKYLIEEDNSYSLNDEALLCLLDEIVQKYDEKDLEGAAEIAKRFAEILDEVEIEEADT